MLLANMLEILKAIADFIRNERESVPGRVNLASIALVVFLTIAIIPPGLLVIIVRTLKGVPFPEWGYGIPLAALLMVILTVVASLAFVPRKPPA